MDLSRLKKDLKHWLKKQHCQHIVFQLDFLWKQSMELPHPMKHLEQWLKHNWKNIIY
jgi:hypothetical protein